MNRLTLDRVEPTPAEGVGERSSRLAPTLAIVAAGTFLALVTYTGPLGNLPTVARALAAGANGQTWILSSTSVALAAVLLTAGALADDHGRRRVFVAGNALIAAGSLVCALATSTAPFILGRLVEGVGSAGIVASSLGLVAALARTPADRAMISGVWGASVGGGIAAGPVITGFLDELHLWRGFYALLALGTVALALVAQRVAAESVAPTPRPVDLPGAGALGLALVLALVALTEGRDGLTPWVATAGGGALAAAALFVVVERRRRAPMLELHLFRDRQFTGATVAALGTGIGVIGVMSFSCNFFITELGLSSLGAALLLLAWSGASTGAALLARCLPPALQGPRQLTLGLAGVAVGELAMVGAVPGPVWHLVPGLAVAGVASGVLNAGLGRQAVATVPPERASVGSGANNTARYLGSSIGVTLVVIVATRTGAGSRPGFAGWNHALILSACAALVTAVVVAALTRRENSSSRNPRGTRITATPRT
jgi:MFS family permease